MKVAIQGEMGSNSHMATLQAFAASGCEVQVVPCNLSADVFAALAAGEAELAVLPIENSLHGSVAEHYDLLLEHDVSVVGETELPIHHNVIAAPGVAFRSLRRVQSHPVALSQCRRWLAAHPWLEVVPCYDTAGSVKMLMEQQSTDTAGIAPNLAAVQYGADVLVEGIEDHRDNFTRFYTLRPGRLSGLAQAGEDADKLSVAFALDHRPGSLVAALETLALLGMNLTRIESRPVPGRPWEYIFYVDLRFDSVAAAGRAIDRLGAGTRMMRFLGCYRAATGATPQT